MPSPDKPENAIVQFRQIFFVGIVMPVLNALAWWKAPQFDPYRMSFFTRAYIEPTSDMPDEFRMFAWVVIGIGVLLGYVVFRGIRKRVHSRTDTVLLGLMALQFATFGGAFLVAADSAEERIVEKNAS